MGNAATAKKGNEQESGEHLESIQLAFSHLILAAADCELAHQIYWRASFSSCAAEADRTVRWAAQNKRTSRAQQCITHVLSLVSMAFLLIRVGNCVTNDAIALFFKWTSEQTTKWPSSSCGRFTIVVDVEKGLGLNKIKAILIVVYWCVSVESTRHPV